MKLDHSSVSYGGGGGNMPSRPDNQQLWEQVMGETYNAKRGFTTWAGLAQLDSPTPLSDVRLESDTSIRGILGIDDELLAEIEAAETPAAAPLLRDTEELARLMKAEPASNDDELPAVVAQPVEREGLFVPFPQLNPAGKIDHNVRDANAILIQMWRQDILAAQKTYTEAVKKIGDGSRATAEELAPLIKMARELYRTLRQHPSTRTTAKKYADGVIKLESLRNKAIQRREEHLAQMDADDRSMPSMDDPAGLSVEVAPPSIVPLDTPIDSPELDDPESPEVVPLDTPIDSPELDDPESPEVVPLESPIDSPELVHDRVARADLFAPLVRADEFLPLPAPIPDFFNDIAEEPISLLEKPFADASRIETSNLPAETQFDLLVSLFRREFPHPNDAYGKKFIEGMRRAVHPLFHNALEYGFRGGEVAGRDRAFIEAFPSIFASSSAEIESAYANLTAPVTVSPAPAEAGLIETTGEYPGLGVLPIDQSEITRTIPGMAVLRPKRSVVMPVSRMPTVPPGLEAYVAQQQLQSMPAFPQETLAIADTVDDLPVAAHPVIVPRGKAPELPLIFRQQTSAALTPPPRTPSHLRTWVAAGIIGALGGGAAATTAIRHYQDVSSADTQAVSSVITSPDTAVEEVSIKPTPVLSKKAPVKVETDSVVVREFQEKNKITPTAEQFEVKAPEQPAAEELNILQRIARRLLPKKELTYREVLDTVPMATVRNAQPKEIWEKPSLMKRIKTWLLG